MKKVWMSVLLIAALTLKGCSGKVSDETGDSGRTYVDGTGSEEDDAVNTFQTGTKYRIVTPMMELKEAVVNIIGENYWPDTLLSSEELAERTGISENMYNSFLAEYQRSEAGIDMMILVEAKEDSIENVERYLNEYRELLLKIYENQPQNKAKVFASRIETIQDYVCYVQLGADMTGLKDLGQDEMVEHCQQDNESAIDIIEKTIMSWEEE
ncbi:MAG: DUF4358 domain-containing protein [Suilimivivens sp.]